jgi:hypothetical protein
LAAARAGVGSLAAGAGCKGITGSEASIQGQTVAAADAAGFLAAS